MQCQYQRDRARPKRGGRACEIPAVVPADGADIGKLIEYEVDRHRAAAAGRAVRQAGQPYEQEREEQRGQKVHGAVLVVQYHEIGTLPFSGRGQVDVAAAEDALDLFALQGLKPRTKTEEDARAHRIAGLTKQVVRRSRRVLYGQLIEQRR